MGTTFNNSEYVQIPALSYLNEERVLVFYFPSTTFTDERGEGGTRGEIFIPDSRLLHFGFYFCEYSLF